MLSRIPISKGKKKKASREEVLQILIQESVEDAQREVLIRFDDLLEQYSVKCRFPACST